MYFFIFHGLIYVYNFFTNLGAAATLDPEVQSKAFALSQAFKIIGRPFWFVSIDFIFSVAIAWYLGFKIRTNYKDLNVGQKGRARWTTLKEIQAQYKEIPDGSGGDSDFYPGGGGVPVSRYKDKLYIDNSAVNNLIIGITRSGKGEMYVFPMIDIYSRAEQKSSMIITDPKLELYANSFDTLQRRGYDVMCLNLVDPLKSMGYNPLQLIIDAFKQEDYDNAELLATTFAFSIYMSGGSEGEGKFWDEQSANMLVAMIFATIEDCLKEDEYENVRLLKIWQSRQKNWSTLSSEKQNEIKQKIILAEVEADRERKRLIKVAETNPHLSRSSGDEFYKEKMRHFWTEEIYDEREFPAIPDTIEFVPTNKYEKQITMYSVYNTMTELARLENKQSGSSALDDYFAKRPVGDRGKMKYAAVEVSGDETMGSIFASCLAEIAIFTTNKIAKMTAHTNFNLEDVGFGDKPMAIFLGIPDYDSSNHFIASVFIRQLYFTLAKKCSEIRSGKCTREVIFLLDEFGNLPAIEGMSNIITVCLGRNIRFNLVIQSYAQIEEKYDKGADTIIGNCGNQIYILTNDKQTAENYSALIGNETITTISRSGQKMSIDKSHTESYEERPLLNSNELMELQVGECVVKRTMARQDLEFNNVTPTPIFNHGKTKFKFRWEYLQTDDKTNHLDKKEARKIEKMENNGKDYLASKGCQWVFPSFYTVDDIAYDESVKNTRMEDITFDIYHFCSDEMTPYIPAGPQQDKFNRLVRVSDGSDYAKRHTDAKITSSRIEAFKNKEDIQKVHSIMSSYIPGIQAFDPTFRNYSFDDCLWKTYKAYLRGKSGDIHTGLSKQEYIEKFDELSNIFFMADGETREKVLRNFPKAKDFMESVNAKLLNKINKKDSFYQLDAEEDDPDYIPNISDLDQGIMDEAGLYT